MRDITLNPKQRLYVIATEGGVTFFGFDNARDHAQQIAQRLDRPDLMPVSYTHLDVYKRQVQCRQPATVNS